MNIPLPPNIENVLGQEHLNAFLTPEFLSRKCTHEQFTDIGMAAEKLRECFKFLESHKLPDFQNTDDQTDQAFIEYFCEKRSWTFGCFETFSTAFDHGCLDDEEMESKNTFIRIIKRFVAQICVDDGAAVLAFVRGKGVECAQKYDEELKQCTVSVAGRFLEKSENDEAPMVSIEPEDCDDLRTMHKCASALLEGCDDGTVREFIDDMWSAIFRETVCIE